MTEEEHDAKLRAEAQALREEVAEYEALCNRQAELLSQSIVAIRGPEPELTRWGYADLPLRVKTIVEEVAALRARVVSESDIFASVQAVRDRYPVVVFPSDGASVDCKSAAMARVVCDAVMKELSILFNQDKENGNG
ncbi:TPA: hypothetical protein L4G80_005993 [Pseudomonas aeruginosa]|nr:hypothetical protein [Pseudomonas aeruginosa]